MNATSAHEGQRWNKQCAWRTTVKEAVRVKDNVEISSKKNAKE